MKYNTEVMGVLLQKTLRSLDDKMQQMTQEFWDGDNSLLAEEDRVLQVIKNHDGCFDFLVNQDDTTWQTTMALESLEKQHIIYSILVDEPHRRYIYCLEED